MNKEELKQELENSFDIDRKSAELADNIKKIKLLVVEMIENYFCLDEEKDEEDIWVFHGNMGVKCDILRDYVNRSQELIKDIGHLSSDALERKLDIYDNTYNAVTPHTQGMT